MNKATIAAWDDWSNNCYLKYRTDDAIRSIISDPQSVFPPEVFDILTQYVGDFKGKRILVPSSGDNHAVFAFYLLGAKVTSCDISSQQLINSKAISDKYGWDIEYKLEDTMQLTTVESNSYDLVYTSNGVHVWIDQLNAMYVNINRVLKRGGYSIMYDVHPFLRPFTIKATDSLTIHKKYDELGPFGDDAPLYKWRIQDFVNAIVKSGLSIKGIEEFCTRDASFWIDEQEENIEDYSEDIRESWLDWTKNPLAALPHWLSIVSSKE